MIILTTEEILDGIIAANCEKELRGFLNRVDEQLRAGEKICCMGHFFQIVSLANERAREFENRVNH